MIHLSTKATIALTILAAFAAGCQTVDVPTNRMIEKTVQSEINNSVIPAKEKPPQRVAEAQNADGEILKCKTERLSGSRLGGQEVCMTQKEWDDVRANNAKQLQEISINGAKNYK